MDKRDFTYQRYQLVLDVLRKSYRALPMTAILDDAAVGVVKIRHDVDRAPGHALQMAILENSKGVISTYYFRDFPQSLDTTAVHAIAQQGHEIGYHYENMAEACVRLRIPKSLIKTIHRHLLPLLADALEKSNSAMYRSNPEILKTGDSTLDGLIKRLFETAIRDFERSLTKIRKLAPIHTISMHGRPGIPIDNRYLWLAYDYRDYGLTLEPYFDIDYNRTLYLTDAGRNWNDPLANKRDKVKSNLQQCFGNSQEIIEAISTGTMHRNILINIHPEHWTDNPVWWWKIHADRKLRNFLKRRMLG